MNPPSPAGVTPWLFRASAVLWVIWGLVHVAAGVLTLSLINSGKTAEAFHGITSAVPLENLSGTDYPAPVSAVLSQHAHNLAWFGAVTLIAAPFIWRRYANAVYLAAIVGGLADVGYFVFIDLQGYATVPGPQMTYICAGAIITGLVGLYLTRAGLSEKLD